MPPVGTVAILPAPVPSKPRTKGAKVVKLRERAAFGLGSSKARPVEVRGLVKRYGELTAVDRVDLTIERGDVYSG